jgi:hypothetical protein
MDWSADAGNQDWSAEAAAAVPADPQAAATGNGGW